MTERLQLAGRVPVPAGLHATPRSETDCLFRDDALGIFLRGTFSVTRREASSGCQRRIDYPFHMDLKRFYLD